jgi:signal transduction histidine kinase
MRPLSERRPTRAQIGAEQLASLSHEFRTPLNGVLGMARLLEGTRLTAEQKTYVHALHDSGQHLLTLVNDVLDFAKLGAGRVELHADRTNLEGLLQGVAELLSPRAREKDLEIAWAAELRRKCGEVHKHRRRFDIGLPDWPRSDPLCRGRHRTGRLAG